MFTGIVQSIGIVRAFQRRSGGARLVVETGLPEELLRIGDSIAVDGCCQTIVQAEGTVCTFDCLEETLRRSVFGEYVPGRPVNIEPALAVGDRLGGHIVQGHVDCVQPVVELRERQGDRHLTIRRPPREEFPVVEKGSVAINGVDAGVFFGLHHPADLGTHGSPCPQVRLKGEPGGRPDWEIRRTISPE